MVKNVKDLVMRDAYQWVSSLLLVLLLGSVAPVQAVDFQYEYDVLNRLVAVIGSDGNVVFYTYDEVGNVLSIIRVATADLPVATTDAVNQGETVELVIRGFDLLPGGVTSANPGVIVDSTSATDTAIQVTLTITPDALLGSTTLTVMTDAGDFSIPITVLGPRPVITSITPQQGTATGGTPVAITGTNLTPDTTITMGGNPATDVVFVDAGTITASTPAGTPGQLVDVIVSNSSGRSRLLGGFAYAFPFSLPGVLAIAIGNQGILTVTLNEPAATDTTLTLTSSNPAVATLPESVIIPAGQGSADIPVTAGDEGLAIVTVWIDGAGLPIPIFVGPPLTLEPNLAIVVIPVGVFITPTDAPELAMAPIVGIQINP